MNNLNIPNLTPDQALLFKGFNIAQNEAERVKNAIEKIEEQELIYVKRDQISFDLKEETGTYQVEYTAGIPFSKLVNFSVCTTSASITANIANVHGNSSIFTIDVKQNEVATGSKNIFIYITYKK